MLKTCYHLYLSRTYQTSCPVLPLNIVLVVIGRVMNARGGVCRYDNRAKEEVRRSFFAF